MKKIAARFFIAFITIFICQENNGQEKAGQLPEFRKNSINGYLGFADHNINYELNISQLQKSYTNIRLGFGLGAFVTAGVGIYLNPALVHLIGKNYSFLELDLGFKYIIQYEGLNPEYSEFFIPDIFAGYRYERPDGKRIFRFGFN